MTRQIPVREWPCSEHDYPQQCECCERWDCDECQACEWVQIGTRDASPWEDMLLSMPTPVFTHGPLIAKLIHEFKEHE